MDVESLCVANLINISFSCNFLYVFLWIAYGYRVMPWALWLFSNAFMIL